MTANHLITERPPAGRWTDLAACRGKNPAWWYPAPGRGVSYQAARPICAACPVRPDCLQYALDAGEEHGLWGGLDPDERARLAHRGGGL